VFLPLTTGLMVSNQSDPELAELADRHYSRRTVGSRQFVGPGAKLVLRDAPGDVLFVWVWHNSKGKQLDRWDKQLGICCSLFRNESSRRSSEIILEAEAFAIEKWGHSRAYTYVDASKISSRNPGYCFKSAGWKFVKRTPKKLHLLEKEL